MNITTLNNTFDPQTLADDLLEVRRIYAQFFAGLVEADWDKPVKGGSKEWTLHETIAHLLALNGAGCVHFYGRPGGVIPTPMELTRFIEHHTKNAWDRESRQESEG